MLLPRYHILVVLMTKPNHLTAALPGQLKKGGEKIMNAFLLKKKKNLKNNLFLKSFKIINPSVHSLPYFVPASNTQLTRLAGSPSNHGFCEFALDF